MCMDEREALISGLSGALGALLTWIVQRLRSIHIEIDFGGKDDDQRE